MVGVHINILKMKSHYVPLLLQLNIPNIPFLRGHFNGPAVLGAVLGDGEVDVFHVVVSLEQRVARAQGAPWLDGLFELHFQEDFAAVLIDDRVAVDIPAEIREGEGNDRGFLAAVDDCGVHPPVPALLVPFGLPSHPDKVIRVDVGRRRGLWRFGGPG